MSENDFNEDIFFKVERSDCFICGNTATPISPPRLVETTTQKDNLLQQWTYECTTLLPEVLKIDPSLKAAFQNREYCSECLNTLREINFLHKSITSFQQRLHQFCTLVKISLRLQAHAKGLVEPNNVTEPNFQKTDVIVRRLYENHLNLSTSSEVDDFFDPISTNINPSAYDEEQPTFSPNKGSISEEPLAYTKSEQLGPKSSILVSLLQAQDLNQQIENNNENGSQKHATRRQYCNWPSCKFFAPNTRSLTFHVNRDHLKDPAPYHCAIQNCSKKFLTSNHLNSHVQIHKLEDIKKERALQSSSKRIQRNEGLIELKKSSTKRMYPCTFSGCTKELATVKSLRRHQCRIHNYAGPKQYYCKSCSLAFNEKPKLKEHLAEAHKDKTSTKNEKKKSPVKTLNRRRILMTNMAFKDPHKNVTQTTCNLCAFLFDQQNENEMEAHLQIHKQRETENRKFSCVVENCDKFYVNSFHLKTHVLSEHSFIGIQCEHCPNVLSSKDSLHAHMKFYHDFTEENSKWKSYKYVNCPECNKKVRNNALKGHMITHSKVKTFSCTKCSEKFRWRVSLRNHLISHLPKEQWPFQCTFSGCNASYVRSNAFKAHEETHAATKTYICEYCSKSFKAQIYLGKHIRIVHKIWKKAKA